MEDSVSSKCKDNKKYTKTENIQVLHMWNIMLDAAFLNSAESKSMSSKISFVCVLVESTPFAL